MSDLILEQFKKHRLIALIRSNNHNIGWQMIETLTKVGIKLIEISWNSDQSARLISQSRSYFPNCQIGVSTILTLRQLREAIACGAQFVFSPHFDPELVDFGINQDIPTIPGAATPTEIVTAWQSGANCVKVFPIKHLGGVDYIKSIKAPLADIPLIPSGGITLDQTRGFLDAGAIAVSLYSDLFPSDLVEQGNWEAIQTRIKQLLDSLWDT